MVLEFLSKKLIYIPIQIGLIALIYFWPLLSAFESQHINHTNHLLIRNAIPTTFLLIVFSLNYFVFIDFFFFKKKNMLFCFLNIVLIVALFFLLDFLINNLEIQPQFSNIKRTPFRYVKNHLQLFLSLILSIGMSIAIKSRIQWNKKEFEIEKIKQVQLDSEIKSLRHQIQPHFLFNTLNNIYSLIDNSPEIAKNSVHNLSNMMRYLLHDTNAERISLKKEIAFLDRYIELMQLRVSVNLKFEKNFPQIIEDKEISPLLLITFVENAFKHGIDAVLDSFITIDFDIQDHLITYQVANSCFPDNKSITDSGIGLENLKKRLTLLYPNKFELSNNFIDETYYAKLILDLS